MYCDLWRQYIQMRKYGKHIFTAGYRHHTVFNHRSWVANSHNLDLFKGLKTWENHYYPPFFHPFHFINFWISTVKTTIALWLAWSSSFQTRQSLLISLYHRSSCTQKWSLFTTSKTDRQLLRQKVHQRISVMKTNTGVFVVFKAKRELKCQFSGNIVCLFSLLRFFD